MGDSKLPVVSSSAASTPFCSAKLHGPGGYLWLDGNGKITADNGTVLHPRPNAFSLVEIQDCPFATPVCSKACYVHGLAKHAPDTHALYKHNSRMMREVVLPGRREEWASNLGDWISANAYGGFRWHVSGDVFSEDYARWIRLVAWVSGVPQWIYTRSFPYLSALLGRDPPPNLTVNLSADQNNYWLARKYADEYGLRVCYLTTDGTVPNDLRKGDVIFPDYSLRAPRTKMVEMINADIAQPMTPSEQREASNWWQSLSGAQQRMVCPVDFYGKSEDIRCGPCNKCLTPAQPRVKVPS